VEDYVATWSSSTDKAAVLILVNDARILRDIPIITMLQLNRKMSKLRNAIPKAIRKRASGSGGLNSGVKRENPQLAPVDMASQGAPDVISSSMMRHLSPEFWSDCYAKVIEEEKKKLEGDQHTEDEEDDYDEITFDENIFTEEEDPEGGSADDGFEGNDVHMRPVGISSSSAQRKRPNRADLRRHSWDKFRTAVADALAAQNCKKVGQQCSVYHPGPCEQLAEYSVENHQGARRGSPRQPRGANGFTPPTSEAAHYSDPPTSSSPT